MYKIPFDIAVNELGGKLVEVSHVEFGKKRLVKAKISFRTDFSPKNAEAVIQERLRRFINKPRNKIGLPAMEFKGYRIGTHSSTLNIEIPVKSKKAAELIVAYANSLKKTAK